MTTVAAVHPGFHLSEGHIHIVIDDKDIRYLSLKETHRLCDRTSAQVHEGLRLEEKTVLTEKVDSRPFGVKLLSLPAPPVARQDLIEHQKTGIVPILLIFATWIPQADDQFQTLTA